ncbi:MAG: hypothetical protein HRU20_23125, partial [Pseudomonadales bacterium]|nr:hypothetical protein [Pseudomonadales bacterium]
MAAILTGDMTEKELDCQHLAASDQKACLFPLSLYGGSKEITVDINAHLLTLAAEDSQIETLGVKARSEVGIRMMDMMDAEFIAFGNTLQARKEGVKYNGKRYETVNYQISRQKLLASSLQINLTRTLSDDDKA